MKNILIFSIAALCLFCSSTVHGQNIAEEKYSKNSYYCGNLVGTYNDSLYYMNLGGSWTPDIMRYIGELSTSEDGNVETIKEGWGVERLQSHPHFSYGGGKIIPTNKYFEYYIGNWKDNVRDGKGFMIRYNGKIIAGEWKNGYIKKKTIRKPTAEEIEYVNRMKEMIDNIRIQDNIVVK